MCGIVGYVGDNDAAPILLHGLKKLEYRGYDSAGIAVRYHEEKPVVIKARGKLEKLIDKTNDGKDIKGFSGIGHTRWATHGKPTEYNAHPHHSDDYNVIGVHNGIIENYRELKEKLLSNGYSFYSETDTEILIKLVDYYLKKYKKGPIDAINKTVVRARGSYALALMFNNNPDEIYFAKKGSPLVVAETENGAFLASDVPALLKYTDKIYYVDDYECGVLKNNHVIFYDLNGDDITSSKHEVEIDFKADAAEMGEFPHYMIKEIEEQPTAIESTLKHYVKDGKINLDSIGINLDCLKEISNIYIFACGSAYHAGLVAGYILEDLTDLNIKVKLASEFIYSSSNPKPNSLAIIISQSGETKDTYEALLKCKEHGIKTLSIINVKNSRIARHSDYTAYTYAGPEIAVATTKAYSCQLIVLYLLSIAIAKAKNSIDDNKYNSMLKDLFKIPDGIRKILKNKENVQRLATRFVPKNDVFFLGRGMDYAISLEGSLKFKEVTYIYSEAYPAGELKHGSIALIQEGVPVIIIATDPNLYEKTLSNMIEVKSRSGSVVAITTNENNVDDCSKYQVYIPEINKYFMPSLAIIPLQLLAYYVSVAKGINPDKPRNLAKSVTVE